MSETDLIALAAVHLDDVVSELGGYHIADLIRLQFESCSFEFGYESTTGLTA